MAKNKLPVIQVIYYAFAYVWWLRKKLALALLPTFSIWLILDLLSLYLSTIEEGPSTELLSLLALPVSILFAITVHRMMILAPEENKKYGVFEWGSREWRFLILVTAIVVIIFALPILSMFFIGQLIDELTFSISWLPLLFIVLAIPRLALVFPATAIDKPLSFKEAWKLSQGNTFR